MFSLMKLEIQKLGISNCIKKVVTINLIIIACMLATLFSLKFENNPSTNTYTNLFFTVRIFVNVVFIIYSSVLLSKLVIEEFKNRTITVLFMYPLSRKKLIISKLLVVVLITFISSLVSSIFISAFLTLASYLLNLIPDTLTLTTILKSLISFIMYSLSAALTSLIPLYFGMRKKSVPATIISSILIVSITNSNSNGFTLNSLVIVPITLSIIGALIACISLRNIDKKDIIN